MKLKPKIQTLRLEWSKTELATITAEGVIRIHEAVKEDKDFLAYLLVHEYGHIGKNWLGDFLWDLRDQFYFKQKVKVWKYMLKYPKIMKVMYLPIHWETKNGEVCLYYNPTMLIFYSFIIAVLCSSI